MAKCLSVDANWLLSGAGSPAPREESSVVRDDVSEYRFTPKTDVWAALKTLKAQVSPDVGDEMERLLLEHQRDRLRKEAGEFFGNAGALADEAQRVAVTLTDAEAAENLRILGAAVERLLPNVETFVDALTKPNR